MNYNLLKSIQVKVNCKKRTKEFAQRLFCIENIKINCPLEESKQPIHSKAFSNEKAREYKL